ncbi:MAG TPA: hypothetical protein DDY49_14850 [Paenibacillaceae bacterium]|nr:hypothetical protein [Paenibacillaceae bacterium]
MSFLKKLIMLISGNHKHGYKHYSSSDYYKHRHPKNHGHHGHNHYGHNHYRKHSSRSFFSS